MRVSSSIIQADHSILTGITAIQHHQEVASARWAINSQAIAGSSQYVHSVPLGKSGCSVLCAIIRGSISVNIQGHVGVYVLGGAASSTSSSIGIMPYSGGTQSYMGGYSRLHGDSYLSDSGMFGNNIRLLEAYISGSNANFVYDNSSVSTMFLTTYGSVIAK